MSEQRASGVRGPGTPEDVDSAELAGPEVGAVGRGPALVLTAEELAVLEQAHLRSLNDLAAGADPAPTDTAPAPTDAGPEPVDAGLVQARRSLMARGLLSPQGLLPEDTDLGLLLQTLLDVRVAAEALVVVERLLGEDRRDLRLLHLVPQGGVVEDVHPDGLHGLDLALDPADLLAAVTQMVVPDDATGGEGRPVTVELSDVTALPELLHRPTVLAELTLVRPQGEETGHLVALGPHGCWAGPRPTGQGPLLLSPVGPGWVGELVGRWIRTVVTGEEGGTMAG